MQHDPEPLYPKAMEMPHLTIPVSERDHTSSLLTLETPPLCFCAESSPCLDSSCLKQ